ncbi:hypothetical protein B566_EDAN012547 [Ephemera danica]|nr:hypothetical protein B566_EDAN012547 [Ephemera danica]
MISHRGMGYDWRGDLGDHGGRGNSWAILVYNSVESVDGVSSVVDGTTSAIGLHERVRSLDNISVASLSLSLVVSGDSVRNGVGEAVLRMSVVFVRDDGLGYYRGSSVGGSGVGGSGVAISRGGVAKGSDDSSASNRDQHGECEDLKHFFVIQLQITRVTLIAIHCVSANIEQIVTLLCHTRANHALLNQFLCGAIIGSHGGAIGGTSVCGSIGSASEGRGGIGSACEGRGGIGSTSVGGGSISSHSGGSNDSLGNCAFLVHNSVESVDGISGVVNNTTGSVSLNERVRSLDNISVAGFSLSLVVSGQSIGHGVRERVLWVGIVLSGDNSLSDGGGSSVSVSRGGIGSTSIGGGSIGSASVGGSGVGSYGSSIGAGNGGSIGSTCVGSGIAVCRGSGIGSHSGGSSVAQRGNHTSADGRNDGGEGKDL